MEIYLKTMLNPAMKGFLSWQPDQCIEDALIS
jgi:hypothetical protein